MLKVCTKCKETKDTTEFGRHRRAKDSLILDQLINKEKDE